ncbi:hypothetical protein OIU76_020396 [Salix suchowensis]|nr:hypothetical protein OIU76_020396 [Salix suchowensis]
MDPRKVKWQQTLTITAVLYHAAQGAFQVPVDESDQAAVSLPSLEKLELNDLPSFATDASSYPAIRELLLGQFSNILEARWLIWNSFNELEVEVVDWMGINKCAHVLIVQTSVLKSSGHSLNMTRINRAAPSATQYSYWLRPTINHHY